MVEGVDGLPGDKTRPTLVPKLADLAVLEGKVIDRRMRRQSHQAFIRFPERRRARSLTAKAVHPMPNSKTPLPGGNISAPPMADFRASWCLAEGRNERRETPCST